MQEEELGGRGGKDLAGLNARGGMGVEWVWPV